MMERNCNDLRGSGAMKNLVCPGCGQPEHFGPCKSAPAEPQFTDRERLDWLECYVSEGFKEHKVTTFERFGGPEADLRPAIDAAMRAAGLKPEGALNPPIVPAEPQFTMAASISVEITKLPVIHHVCDSSEENALFSVQKAAGLKPEGALNPPIVPAEPQFTDRERDLFRSGMAHMLDNGKLVVSDEIDAAMRAAGLKPEGV